MKKKLSILLVSAAMIIASAIPAFAAYKTIDSVDISLLYTAFSSGSYDDESCVDVNLHSASGLYSVSSTKMNVPANGWRAGDRPNFRISLQVEDEDNYRFSYAASRPDGVLVDGGEPHYGELSSGGKKVYYEIYLDEVEDDGWNEWDDDRSWSDDTSNGGPGVTSTSGAWLIDPVTRRAWYSLSNGTRPVKSWLNIGGTWYYFDEYGFRVDNSWILWQNGWYYVGADGSMYKGRRTPDGYYVNDQGLWDGRGKA